MAEYVTSQQQLAEYLSPKNKNACRYVFPRDKTTVSISRLDNTYAIYCRYCGLLYRL